MTVSGFVAFDRVEKSFPDGTRALAGVSFAVAAGEFCVILGPSGSGKSTLLRTLNGLVTADRGTVTVAGLELSRATLPAARRRVAMIYQQFALVGRASVAHNVMAGAVPEMPAWRALLGVYSSRDRARACALLASVGLEPRHLRRRVDELSGGQQQRVGIARAFMSGPQVILADEPVASLDPGTAREIMMLLRREARDRGATVLCSLHQLDLATAFADRLVALREGAVVYNGPPSGLTSAAENRIYAGRNIESGAVEAALAS